MFDETKIPHYNAYVKKTLPFLFVFSCLLSVWELVCLRFGDMLFVLPKPSLIAQTLWVLRANFWFHTCVTLEEMLLGFCFALLVAFPLAWTMLRFATTRTLLQPLFVVIQCIPMFALAPIMVVLFGWTKAAIVIPTALMIFFPLTLNIYQGLRATPRPLLEYFALNGATTWQTLTKLRLPYAMPHVFAGFRISAAIAGVGAVAGEWAGAQSGLGVLMLESRRNLDLEITFGALFCLTVMSTLLYSATILFESLPKKLHFEWSGRILKRKPCLAILCLLLLLTGCHEQPKQTRLLLDWLPNPNHVPLFAGYEKGFFAEEGIDLQIQKMVECGGGINYLTSHQADMVVSHLPSTLKATAKGAELKIVGQMVDSSLRALIYLKDDAVQTPSDLSGKSFGYCIGGPDTSFIDYLLSVSSIRPIERKNVSADMIAPMGTGAIDFVYGGYWNVEHHLMNSLGIENQYFTFDDLNIPTYHELVILANANTPQTRPEFAIRFGRALQKSIDFAKENPEEAFAIYLKANPNKSSRTVNWERLSWQETAPLFCSNQEVDFNLIQNYLEWQVERSIIHNTYDVSCLDFSK
ncbi:MAG: hypothetical protein SP1CHLAM42_05820 [Chlamydiales bacterium]|nr:hypothetical protein [Chlamydiales bacterium]